MFPQSYISVTENSDNSENSENTNSLAYDTLSTELCYTPNYNFETFQTVLKNGSPELIKDYRNIKNWFVKFVFTPIDKLKIYEGTGFGTSILSLIGKKDISCLELAQVKKEIEDGAILHPAISRISEVKLYKIKSQLNIEITANLKNGVVWSDTIEVIDFYG